MVASENYKRLLRRFLVTGLTAASCFIKVRHTFSQVGFSGSRSGLGLFQGILSHGEDNLYLRLAIAHGGGYESFLHWI